MQQPQHHHLTAAKHVLRYLSSTLNLGLSFTLSPHKPNDIIIVGWCDADWGTDKSDRKSTSGNCIFINNNLASWQTKKQPTVALSSAEAELMSLVELSKDILFYRHILTQLQYNIIYPIILNVDNQSAIKIAEHDVFRDRTKHIDIKHHFLHNLINDNIIALNWIETKLQLADIFTKPLSHDIFVQHRTKLLSSIL
jgi:histone deacetylase 1/2